MDELPTQPTDDTDDSPAAGEKTRTRVRRGKPNPNDDEPRPAIKRKFKRGTVEVRPGAQAGGPHPGASGPEDTPPCPPPLSQAPLFGFGSPQESWLEAPESPSPTSRTNLTPHPACVHSSIESSVPSISVDGRNELRRRQGFLGSGHVSTVLSLNATKFLTDDSGLSGVGRQYPNASTLHPYEVESDAREPHTNFSASKAATSGVSNGVHYIGEWNRGFMTQLPNNQEVHVDRFSSRPSGMSSSSTNGLYKSPYTLPLPCKNLSQAPNSSTEALEMALNGLEAAAVIEWQPAGLLCMDNQEPECQYALLVLNQPIQNLNMLRLIWKKAFFRIAADGGANHLSDAFKDPCLNEDFERIGLEVICGDLDSLFNRVREDAQRRGTKVVEDPDQNSTDFTKCVVYLRENIFNRRRLASDIVCLGGLGGRIDQALSQLHHLYMAQQEYTNGRIYLLSTEGITFILKKGRHRIRVHDPHSPVLGKHIGIIPLKEPSIITTRGLEWDVADWPTAFGGQISTSNHVREDTVNITTTGDVLFTIDLNFPAGNHEHPELRRDITPIISMEDDMFFGIETNPYSY